MEKPSTSQWLHSTTALKRVSGRDQYKFPGQSEVEAAPWQAFPFCHRSGTARPQPGIHRLAGHLLTMTALPWVFCRAHTKSDCELLIIGWRIQAGTPPTVDVIAAIVQGTLKMVPSGNHLEHSLLRVEPVFFRSLYPEQVAALLSLHRPCPHCAKLRLVWFVCMITFKYCKSLLFLLTEKWQNDCSSEGFG